jgi:hypothetical protein
MVSIALICTTVLNPLVGQLTKLTTAVISQFSSTNESIVTEAATAAASGTERPFIKLF